MSEEKRIKTHPLMIFKFTRRYIFILLLPLVRSLFNYGATGVLSNLVITELILSVLIILVSVLRWLSFTLTLHADCMVVDFGLFVRRHAVIPLSKVSVLSVIKGPVLFLFGAVSARLDTDSGRGEKADFEIYLSFKNAERLLSVAGDEKKGEVRYRSRIGMATIMAIANASALTGLIILAPAIKRMGEILGRQINNDLRDTLSVASALLGRIVPPAATIIAVIFASGFAVSFILSFIKYTPFKLHDSRRKITIKHGFISHHTTEIAREYINAVIIMVPPIMRFLRFCWVGVSSAGYGKRRGESEVVLPAVKLREANDFQLRIFDISVKEKYDLSCPKRTMKRAVILPIVILALSVLLEIYLINIFHVFSGMIVLIMSFIQLVTIYYLSVRVDYQRNGGVSFYDGVVMDSYRRLTLKKLRVKRDKACMIKISQGPFERKYGVVRMAVTVRSQRPLTLKAVNLDKKEAEKAVRRYFKSQKP